MAKKLLIDATHAEETRVVVLDGTKVEDFDFETIHKRQLAGNIYLAKVTRVEPSLQAAFVDYGGNRHGFLAFAEIHPDYYQIPVADRQALLEEERVLARDQEDEENGNGNGGRGGGRGGGRRGNRRRQQQSGPASEAGPESTPETGVTETGEAETAEAAGAETPAPATPETAQSPAGSSSAPIAEDTGLPPARVARGMDIVDVDAADDAADANSDEAGDPAGAAAALAAEPGQDEPEPYRAADHATELDDQIESVADEDISDEVRPPRRPRARRYKIQEVIKVRQIMLVQVVKEERGNKGAALTTYLSLAGRYCVLMPNTGRGGGISRKITNAADRKKLKETASEMEVPEGAGLIIRTAGAQRTKAEIKRDYEYLFRLWEQIRDLTLKSVAPAPIYEEGDLIKRSIRDLYNKDIDEVLVEGEAGFRAARDFMKMIMPSHARNVKPYNDPLPLFARHKVESYLTGMFNPTVQLKSGGYIVIGVTEALVAIDINSGKATRQGSIEETALQTNLEAADEIARQLRLRDLAGLIVIDFIDMEERRNNAAVEKRLKDALRNDRARIQVGRISGFGLLEMSRQRLRPGMLEATTQPCPHCHGTGLIRSDNSIALAILRALEEEGVRKRSREVLLRAPVGVVNYLFNNKREHLAQIEARYGMAIRLEGDPTLISPDYSLEKFKTATRQVRALPVVSLDVQTMSDVDGDLVEDDQDTAAEAEVEAEAAAVVEPVGDGGADASEGGRRKRRRWRRRRGSDGSEAGNDKDATSSDAGAVETGASGEEAGEASDTGAREASASTSMPEAAPASAEAVSEAASTETPEPAAAESDAPAKKPRPARRRSGKKAQAGAAAETGTVAEEAPTTEAEKPAAAPRRTRRKAPASAATTEGAVPEDAVSEVPAQQPATEPAPEPAIVADAEAEAAADRPVRPLVEPAPGIAPPMELRLAPEFAANPAPEAEAQPDGDLAESGPTETDPVKADAETGTSPEAPDTVTAEASTTESSEPRKPRRAGWWSRKT